jgi:hypothetical protein
VARNHVGPRHHDFPHDRFTEFEDGVEHLPLAFVDDPFFFRLLDDGLKFFLGQYPPPSEKDPLEHLQPGRRASVAVAPSAGSSVGTVFVVQSLFSSFVLGPRLSGKEQLDGEGDGDSEQSPRQDLPQGMYFQEQPALADHRRHDEGEDG